jgi:hypothetical protein
MSKWRSAQNPTAPACVGHGIGEVGEASGNEFKLKWLDEIGDAFEHPMGEIGGVNANNVA